MDDGMILEEYTMLQKPTIELERIITSGLLKIPFCMMNICSI